LRQREARMTVARTRLQVVQSLVVLSAAFAMKWWYSAASVNDLRWILTPTTILVELVSGESFIFESHAGYMSGDHSFLIAAPCSGINFLTTAFLMLTLMRIWRSGPKPAGLVLLPIAAAAAFLTTIVANTVRISVPLRLHRMDRDLVWMNPDQLHRFEGIFIYFGFLLLLFILSEAVHRESSTRSDRASALFRRSWLPLLIYWLTTLGIPLANGAYGQGSVFWEHATFVLLTPLILILPVAVFGLFASNHSPPPRSFADL
jgi:exosortase K